MDLMEEKLDDAVQEPKLSGSLLDEKKNEVVPPLQKFPDKLKNRLLALNAVRDNSTKTDTEQMIVTNQLQKIMNSQQLTAPGEFVTHEYIKRELARKATMSRNYNKKRSSDAKHKEKKEKSPKTARTIVKRIPGSKNSNKSKYKNIPQQERCDFKANSDTQLKDLDKSTIMAALSISDNKNKRPPASKYSLYNLIENTIKSEIVDDDIGQQKTLPDTSWSKHDQLNEIELKEEDTEGTLDVMPRRIPYAKQSRRRGDSIKHDSNTSTHPEAKEEFSSLKVKLSKKKKLETPGEHDIIDSS
ncbi:hypothetical protein SK128_010623 [Halocaridina rubra]|uniref:Uncharacterized protein n=1 Tax=Halocaridina rubra TaxID=373956 RepID=A0AAN8WYZ4_HALRR